MSIKIIQNAGKFDENYDKSIQHAVHVLADTNVNQLAFSALLVAKLTRAQKTVDDLKNSPVTLDLPDGNSASVVIADENLTPFKRFTLLRKAVVPLLNEHPTEIALCVYGEQKTSEDNACAAYYVIQTNSIKLPHYKKEKHINVLSEVHLFGLVADHKFEHTAAKAAGNALCRSLSIAAPNKLTPTIYRNKIKELAKEYGWKHEEYDMHTLQTMGAGAFVAVGQGSDPLDAAIVHLTYNPSQSKKQIALVGKGICFDTGGHNLKPAKYMLGMHEDMNGSAVVLGILVAATKMKLPIKLDCWLAIAQNHISPSAYKQNDIVKALNGMTIEIVHTDAEGRMVLADTLTLASRLKPDFIIDFATLTGSMITALGDRMSGIISNSPQLACKAVGAGQKSGERVAAFPFEEDYDADLESDVADIKQCTLEGGGDHLHAARFLSKFIENDIPWLHTDLSSANRKGGLGAIESDTNGFGVGFGIELLNQLLSDQVSLTPAAT